MCVDVQTSLKAGESHDDPQYEERMRQYSQLVISVAIYWLF